MTFEARDVGSRGDVSVTKTRSPSAASSHPVLQLLTYQAMGCIILLVLFLLNTPRLFTDHDGIFFRLRLLHWLNVGVLRRYFTYNIFQGFGDLEFPLNYSFSLPSLLTAAFYKLGFSELLYYYFCSIMVFYLTTKLLHFAGFGFRVSIFFATIFIGIVLGYFGPLRIFDIFAIAPWFMEVMVYTSAMAVLIVPVMAMDTPRAKRILLMLAFFGLASILVMSAPAGTILAAPVITILLLTIGAPGARPLWRQDRQAVLLFVFFSILFAVIFGPFNLGIVLNSPSGVFTEEIVAPRMALTLVATINLSLASALSLKAMLLDPGSLFYLLSVVGSIWAVIYYKDNRRLLFLGVVVCLGLLLVLGAYTLVTPRYTAISPIYFEWNLWPIMFVGSIVGLRAIAERLIPAFRRSIVSTSPLTAAPRILAAEFLVIALTSLIGAAVARPLLTKNLYPIGQVSVKPPFMADIEAGIGVHDGEALHGLLLNISSAAKRDANGLLFWSEVWQNDIRYNSVFGGIYFRTNETWAFDIPAVLEFSQVMSPFTYYITTRAFAEPRDQRMRVLLMMSRTNPKWQRIMGVRYVLADSPIDTTNLTIIRKYPTAFQPNDPLVLYEVADWRPFSVFDTVPASETIVAEMQSPNDPGRAALTTDGLNVDVRESGITITKSTAGPVSLAIPVVFSNCFSVIAADPATQIDLVPAYGATLGVRIFGPGTFKIQYRNSPLDNPWCRIKDWEQSKATFKVEPEWIANILLTNWTFK